MSKNLEKRYGLLVATAMVVGTVIGSGVFFKAEKVLVATEGDLKLGILSWIIGGMIMVSCAYTFSIMANKHSDAAGLYDYAKIAVGQKYAYAVNWFSAYIYMPSMCSVVSWVAARYTGVLFGWDIVGGEVMMLTGVYLMAIFTLNTLSPSLAGYFQVSTTIIKMIPLLLMAVVGFIVGLNNGQLAENFATVNHEITMGSGLLTAVVATAFAYEGWIVATTIASELKNPKRDMPIALVAGTLIVITTYVLYYVGLSGAVSNAELMANGEQGAKMAFSALFSNLGGTALFVFVVISCLGTVNGLFVGTTRSIYNMAHQNVGIKPKLLASIDAETVMPANATAIALLVNCFWLVYFYGANLVPVPWFGSLSYDSSELAIINMYAFYIPIFIMMMVQNKEMGIFKRFIAPTVAIAGCIFMVYAACISHGWSVLAYLASFIVIMLLAIPFAKKQKPIQ